MFDLSTVKELDCATLKLTHPGTGALIGAEITLASANHPKRKSIEFNHSRVLRAKMAKKGRFELNDPQDDAEFEVDRLVGCTLGWSGFVRDGKPIECTPGEARAVYEATAWLREQCNAFMGDAVNFLHSTKPD